MQKRASNKASVYYNKKSPQLYKNCHQADKQMAQTSTSHDRLMRRLEWARGVIHHMVAVHQPGEEAQLRSEVVLGEVLLRHTAEVRRSMAQQLHMGKVSGEEWTFTSKSP